MCVRLFLRVIYRITDSYRNETTEHKCVCVYYMGVCEYTIMITHIKKPNRTAHHQQKRQYINAVKAGSYAAAAFACAWHMVFSVDRSDVVFVCMRVCLRLCCSYRTTHLQLNKRTNKHIALRNVYNGMFKTHTGMTTSYPPGEHNETPSQSNRRAKQLLV